MAGKFNFGASLQTGSFCSSNLISGKTASSHGKQSDRQKDVNMAAGRRVHSLYDLATFTTVRNCDLFKLEYRSLPNAVQCDIYRTVCILILSSYFFFALLPRQLMFTKFV